MWCLQLEVLGSLCLAPVPVRPLWLQVHRLLAIACRLQVLRQRPDLKVVIMSATLEADKFQGVST